MKKKITALLILAAMLCSMAASCSETGTNTETTAPTNTTGNGETTAPTEETKEDYAEYMPTANYNGASFSILNCTNPGWCLTQVDAEESIGEIFNDTIHNRNLKIEELLNVVISTYESDDVGGEIRKAVTGGDATHSIAYPDLSSAASLAASKNLINLATVEGLNLNMPWWDAASIDSLTIKDKLYFAENEINIQYNEATWVLYFNKYLVTQFNLDSPYDLVRENEWTMDKMHEMMGVVASDANGDGVLNAPDDYFGFSTHASSFLGMLAGSGQALIVPDGEGGYVPNMTNEKMVDIAAKIGSIINDMEATVLPDRFPGAASADGEWARNTFYNGHSLFYGEVIGMFAANLRDMEQDFGLIPFPKFETSQDHYTCQVLTSARAYAIPSSGVDLKMTADVTEALAIESLNKFRPAYLDATITGKSMRDEESREMLELIFEYRIFDIGTIFGWGGVAGSFQNAINNGGENYMSSVQKNEKAVKKAIQNALKTFGEEDE